MAIKTLDAVSLEKSMLKFDLHMHSHFSYDSLSVPEKIVEKAIERGIDGIAITDHNVFRIDWSALQDKYPELIIIPGTEIGTKGVGDILCYFIKEAITSKDPEEVVSQVHSQGGIAVLAHPFHHGRTIEAYPDHILEKLDAIETSNAHNVCNNKRAKEMAQHLGKSQTGGSDAHVLSEIGLGYTLVDSSKTDAGNETKLKLAILKSPETHCSCAPAFSFYFSQSIKYLKRFKVLKQKV